MVAPVVVPVMAPVIAHAMAPAIASPAPQGRRPPEPAILRLERSWRELDQQLRALDALIPAEPTGVEGVAPEFLLTPPLPRSLLAPNAAPSGPLAPADSLPPAPLSLPDPGSLNAGRIASLSLEQAVAIAFANNPALQQRRLTVAAALAELQASLGTYWPRLLAFADATTGRSQQSSNAPKGNTQLGLGPNFAPGGPFAVPSGGELSLGSYASGGVVGLQLEVALLDFARTPGVRAARARLQAARGEYANQLRQLQLQVSEAYFQLQQADQNVRIQEAAVRNDLVILQEALDLQRAGLVPRLDALRRRAIEASDQEALIQALADRAIARRQLAVVLNLPAALTPTARDPITPAPAWPLDLEASLLAAYRGNPELEAILATREALARDRDAVAAGLLPRLSLFAGGGGNASNTNSFNLSLANGGCCGTTYIPVQNSSGADWSLGLSLRWLLFDAGITGGQARALALRAQASEQEWAARRDAIRLRLETAFLQHEASLARLSAARRGVAASLEAFRDVRLRYQSGLSSEVDVSLTQEQLIRSLVQRLNATVAVNVSYARLLRELLPVPRDPSAPLAPQLRWADPALSSAP
jgi:outer membrane protein TolC